MAQIPRQMWWYHHIDSHINFQSSISKQCEAPEISLKSGSKMVEEKNTTEMRHSLPLTPKDPDHKNGSC